MEAAEGMKKLIEDYTNTVKKASERLKVGIKENQYNRQRRREEQRRYQ